MLNAHRKAPRWYRHRLLVLLVLLGVATGRVHAQENAQEIEESEADEGPSAADLRKAKKLLARADRNKRHGDRHHRRQRTKRAMKHYRQAALTYLEAYSLAPDPTVIFKLAQVYDKRGEVAWALRGYKSYVSQAPRGEQAETSRACIAALSAQIADNPPAEPADIELDPTVAFGLEGEKSSSDETEPAQPGADSPQAAPTDAAPSEQTPAPQKPPRHSSGRKLRIAGIASGASGGLFLLLALKYGSDAVSASNELTTNRDRWSEADQALIDKGQRAETKAIVFTILGLAAAGAGGTLYYWGWKRGRDAKSARGRTVWMPELTPTSISLVLGGRF